MKIALIINKEKDPDYKHTKKIVSIIEKLDMEYYIVDCLKGGENYTYTNPKQIPKDIDLIITLGGDGTILQAARDIRGYNYPIAGINYGTLGYLAETEIHQVEEMLKKVKKGDYILENRMMLDGYIGKRGQNFTDADSHCLNDIVIKNTEPLKTVAINIYVNDKFITKYYADGIIVSTPTGSTAYNLTAGGPIIEPTTSMIIVTPLCSFTLGLGSIVFDGKDKIELEIDTGRKKENLKTVAIFDGVKQIPLKSGDTICIKKSKYNARFMKFTETSFLEILREKMKK